jgi:hypothetical protein
LVDKIRRFLVQKKPVSSGGNGFRKGKPVPNVSSDTTRICFAHIWLAIYPVSRRSAAGKLAETAVMATAIAKNIGDHFEQRGALSIAGKTTRILPISVRIPLSR